MKKFQHHFPKPFQSCAVVHYIRRERCWCGEAARVAGLFVYIFLSISGEMLSLWIFYLPLHELFISCALSCWCLFARRAQHQPKHAAAARARSITWQFGARAICWCRDMTRNLLPSLRSPPAPLILHWAPALLLLSLSLVRFHPSGRGGYMPERVKSCKVLETLWWAWALISCMHIGVDAAQCQI